MAKWQSWITSRRLGVGSTCAAVCLFASAATAQTLNPVITGIRNAASDAAGPIAPRMIAVVRGTNLANSVDVQPCGQVTPLPLVCDGTSVLIDGKAAPIIDASSSQVTFQVPVDIGGGSVSLQVAVQAGTQRLQSTAVNVPTAATNPALFTRNAGDLTLGAFEMIKTVQIDPAICAILGSCTSQVVVTVSPSAPAHPGDTVHIFGTGLGATDPSSASGIPPPADAKLANTVILTVAGRQASGVSAKPSGLVGQDYVAFTVPAVPVSGNQPVVLTSGLATSPAVLLPISVLQSSITGVANSASGGSTITTGSWVSIYGTDLSVTTRSWQISDFSGSNLPLSLDGVSVTINGRDAAVSYVSPGQVNVQAPADSATGPVQVRVTNASTSTTSTVILQDYAPGFFTFQGKYVAAVHTDGAFVAPVGYLGSSVVSRPARPGEVILLFGTGFGPTTPAVPAGQVFFGAAPLTDTARLHVRVGGALAAVQFAGLVAAGEYQFNMVVPAASDGDQVIVADIGGVNSQASLLIPIKN